MAPGILAAASPEPAHLLGAKRTTNDAPREIFPDGIRTSGQLDPIYDLLQPYESFPSHIEGPTVWTRDQFEGKPEKWVHRFTPEEIDELGEACDQFIADGIPLTGISKSNFPLPQLSRRLETLRQDLLNGKGFILFKGFPTQAWGNHKSAVGYMGLGTYLGYFVSQNGRGHVLGHVKDVGDDASQIDKIRIYRTNARQFFHADDSDLVGLLCMHRALEGGESDLVSSHRVWNVLRQERPDVARLLTEPIWYFDRKGETSVGQKEWMRAPVFYKEVGKNGRVYSRWDPYFIKSLSRFSDKGKLLPFITRYSCR